MPSQLPDDPLIRELVTMARRSMLSRRQLLKGAGVGAATLALAACAPDSTSPAALHPAADASGTEQTVTWSNWPAYLDEAADGTHPTLADFTTQTGVTVNYVEDVEDNNEYYGTEKGKLALGQSTGADLFCITEWLAARLVRFGYVQKLDAASMPNRKYIATALLNPDFDPGRKYTLPWQNGFTGLAWNVDEVPKGLREVDDLWKPKLKGKVTVLSEMRDTMGLILQGQGVDISKNDWGNDQFSSAIEVLEKQVKAKQLLGVRGNEYIDDLVSGDAVAAIAWSGDIAVLNERAGREKWKFAMPASGGTLWGDSFVIPMGATHKANAEKLMNYYYDPYVACEVAAWTHFITPVVGTFEAAQERHPDLANDQLVFPSEETLAASHIFRTLAPVDDQSFNGEFQRVIGAA